MIETHDLTYRYADGRCAVDGVNLAIKPGERVVLLGANGCGKTTLLRLLDGLFAPAAGSVHYDGVELSAARLAEREFSRRFRREVALLFQQPAAMLFNPTVYDEIAFGPRQFGLDDVDGRVRRLAGQLCLTEHLPRPPYELSGGEQQRLALAALLVMEPRLLLMDEPTANLDPRSSGWLIDFLADLAVTSVISTHNLSIAAELGQRAVVLSERHQIIYDGPVDELLRRPEVLLAANLLHRHRHRHGGLEHRHFHAHDWE
jgi:cobalt/nickel transport system ATP-binding protein